MSPSSWRCVPETSRYNAIPLAAAPEVDATLAYAAMRSPISNTFARYENAVRRGNEDMVKFNKTFFDPWETIHEANPQEILDRGEKIALVPFLIMQGALDDNVLPEAQEKFVRAYQAAGGSCEYHLFENSVHEWVANEGPQTQKARRDGQGVYRAPAQGLSAAEQTAAQPWAEWTAWTPSWVTRAE